MWTNLSPHRLDFQGGEFSGGAENHRFLCARRHWQLAVETGRSSQALHRALRADRLAVFRHAAFVDDGLDFHPHMKRLIGELARS